jgi:pimeloyl-ACP methyl ester carboxylesterase
MGDHGDAARDTLLADSGLTERRVILEGASTPLLEGGAGPPLLLLHGGIEVGAAYWTPITRALATDYRVIAPDLPGLGESEPLPRRGQEEFERWLAALIAETCDSRPTVIAHSLVASFTARACARQADLANELVVYACPGIGPYRMSGGLRLAAIRFALRPSRINAERIERWAFFDLDAARRRAPQWLEAFESYLRDRAGAPHVQRTMRALVRSGTKRIPDADLRRLEVPVGLLWGNRDRFVPLRVGEDACRRLGWRLCVVDEIGHVPHIERPRGFLDAFAGVRSE